MFKKGDILVFVIVALLFVGFVGYKLSAAGEGGRRIATISQYGKTVRTIDLSAVTKAEDIKLPGAHDVVIRVEPGRICFWQSVTPAQIGVKTGWISNAGDFAACVPAQAYIRISGKSTEKVDTVCY